MIFLLAFVSHCVRITIVTKTKGLTMLQLLITNELKKRLNRTVTPSEQYNAFKYVSDNLDVNATLNDVADVLADFITDTYCLCDQCGEYVLRTETTEINGPYHHYRVCRNADCEQRAYYDANNDQYQELRTY